MFIIFTVRPKLFASTQSDRSSRGDSFTLCEGGDIKRAEIDLQQPSISKNKQMKPVYTQ